MEDFVLIPMTIQSFKKMVKEIVFEAISEYESRTPKITQDELLTQTQLSEFLKISVPTLIRLKKDGLIPYRKINSRVYYLKSEVLESLKKFNTTEKNQDHYKIFNVKKRSR